jgi:hypothetical protein
MCATFARRSSLEAKSSQEEMGGEERGNARNSPVVVWHGKQRTPVARACIPNGKLKYFYHSNPSSCGRRAKRAECGRVRSRNMCSGVVLIAVRQGRQRRGRCRSKRRATRQMYNGAALSFAAKYLRQVRVVGR